MNPRAPHGAAAGDDGEDSSDETEADSTAVPEKGDAMAPRHVRAAAKGLAKEGRKILKKHGGRIATTAAESIRVCIAEIDKLRDTQDFRALEEHAKRLDELLHRHAAFARKSALRETVENIGIAVIIALGLRSCLYEPFKIPSGSMMPTLRAGDHIFVNKFAYGVQIPFTTTVVGESIGEISRGDVIVFRYPIDESEDFIKRVMALPGDEIRVVGRQVALKRAGEAEFEVLPHKRLDRRCFDDAGVKQIANCALYEETSGDVTYVVRYVLTPEERNDIGAAKPRVWKVPQGHLLVMGDNRNRSHDSLAWTVSVEAIRADKLIASKDLRDLTEERLFEMEHASEDDEDFAMSDPQHDVVTYTASHRSLQHDMVLHVWRAPTLGVSAVYDTRLARIVGATPRTIESLIEGADPPGGTQRARMLELGSKVAAMAVANRDETWTALVQTAEPAGVLQLSCGTAVCTSEAGLAMRLADVLDRFVRNPDQEARLLLERSNTAKYSSHWSGRHNPKDHWWERRFAKGGEAAGPRAQVRLRAFRDPEEQVEFVRDAALAEVGASVDDATALHDAGPDAWLVERDDDWTFVATDHAREFAVVLTCGKAVCRTQERATELALAVNERVGVAAGDRRRMVDLLTPKDVDGLPEIPVPQPELYEYDDVRLEATIKDEAHSLQLEAWLRPEAGVAAKVAAVRDTVGGLSPDDSVAEGGHYAELDGAHTFVFGVPESDVVIRMTCHAGLCGDRASAQAVAQRAATTALDTSTFVDADADRPRPFVPRGNVKGRAERIWLPLSRFWLPIR